MTKDALTPHPLIVIYRYLLIICIALGSTQCAPPTPDASVVAFDQLMTGIRMGDAQLVWSQLSTTTRDTFSKTMGLEPSLNAKGIQERLRISLDWSFESPFGHKAQVYTPPRAASIPSGQKLISVFYANQRWIIPAVQEQGEWRISLSEARALQLHPD